MKCKKCWIAAAILCATMAATALAGCSFGGSDTSSAVVSEANTDANSSTVSAITMNGSEGTASTPTSAVGVYYWTSLSDDGKSFHSTEELLTIMQTDPDHPNYVPSDQIDTVRQQMAATCVTLDADGTGSLCDGTHTNAFLWSISGEEITFTNPEDPDPETDIVGTIKDDVITIDFSGDGTLYYEFTK